jgi:hypothetical protein
MGFLTGLMGIIIIFSGAFFGLALDFVDNYP